MEPIFILTLVGITALALSLKHIISSCKSNNYQEVSTTVVENSNEDAPPKYEEIYNN